MAHLLGAQSLHVSLPDRVLLADVGLGIDEGDRIGVVGRNGDGKSTLLRLLAGRQEPDGGRVTVRGGVRVGVLSQQDAPGDGESVRSRVLQDRPEHAWASDPRIRDVLSGLLPGIALDSSLDALSGGQLRRVHLAQLLVGEWDVLMLDEPTNHLDVEGITWLAQHLRSRWSPRAGGLVVITHDRWFLDAVCTRMWEVHDGVVDPFEGGYAAYVLQRVERDRQAAAVEARRQNLMRKELAWLRRGAPARTSKPKFRIDAAQELIAGEPPVRDTVELAQLATSRLGRDVIDLLEVTADYGDGPVLEDVTLHIGPADRLGILGPNGAGKSTLLALVSGELPPAAGQVRRGTTVHVRQVSQRLEELDEHQDVRVSDLIGAFRTSFRSGKEEVTPGQLLERLGFTTAHQKVRVRELSGGQRRRLNLLVTLLEEPNVLILDEPTNDMDTDMLAAMEDLLDTWPGPLIVVSHDRYLLERVTDDQYAVLEGRVRHLPGGVDEYLALRSWTPLGSAGTSGGGRAEDPAPEAPSLSGSEVRAIQKEVASLERRMERLREQAAAARVALADLDQSDFQQLAAEVARINALDEEADSLEENWLEASERLE